MPWPRFRFSLASLLFLFTIAAITCGWYLHQRNLNASLRSVRDQLALAQNQETTSEPVNQVFADAVVGEVGPDRSRRCGTRDGYVGKRVQVEGIAWGQPFGSSTNSLSPWAQAHVSFDGGEIFLQGADFANDGMKGKLVRVTGTLRCDPGAHSRFGDIPKYYFIEVESYESIDMVEEPLLLALEEIDTPITAVPAEE